ncbi:MAG TPA: hypothetical protein VEX67_09155 [Solirubrobacteraceae bacterium]|nr:hypothetical protein [Solirubrobacteraceae bacterium]
MTGLLNARRERRIADAVIRDPEEHTVMDEHGAVRSIQAADVTVPADELDKLWNATNLERLARTYWKYLSRVTLGLIRVTYTEDERKVVLLFRPLVLLRFRAPEYDLAPNRGVVRWRIEDGLLVSPRGRGGNGYLEIDVRRLPSEQDGRGTVHVEVEVASFYPAIATWLTKFVYSHTQSRIHVLVTHGFLRSLARLDLEESAVGRFSEQQRGVRREKDGALTVGDTPWAVVAALAAAAAAAAGVVALVLWLTRD